MSELTKKLPLLSGLLGKNNVLLVDAVGLLLRAHVVLNVAGEGVLLLLLSLT